MNVIGKCGVDISIMLMERRGASGKEIGFLCIKININNSTSIVWNYYSCKCYLYMCTANLFKMIKWGNLCNHISLLKQLYLHVIFFPGLLHKLNCTNRGIVNHSYLHCVYAIASCRALADILRQQGPIPISQYDCENFAAMNSSSKGDTPQRTGSKNHYTPVHTSKSNHGESLDNPNY